MIHIRAVSPTDVTPRLVESLGANGGVVNLVVLAGVARNPDGDSIQFDVITAEANRVIDELRRLELDQRGSIVIENVDTSISELAAQAEHREPTKANFSPIWEEAEARIRERGTYRPSWFALLAIAGIIGAVGILTNSQILIVGAMVVGPEYGAMISVSLGIDKRDGVPIKRGLNALIFGFLLAIVVTLLFSVLIRAVDLQHRGGPRRHRRRGVADRGESQHAHRSVRLGDHDSRRRPRRGDGAPGDARRSSGARSRVGLARSSRPLLVDVRREHRRVAVVAR